MVQVDASGSDVVPVGKSATEPIPRTTSCSTASTPVDALPIYGYTKYIKAIVESVGRSLAERLRMAVQEYARFIRESIKRPGRVGAIAPSTQRLATHMVRWIDWESVNTVVEYGPGTGVFTSEILRSKRPDAHFFAVELHSEFASALSEQYPDVPILEDSVANIEALCQQQGVTEVDAIICGLPWAAFSDSAQTEYLDAMMKVLKPGGQLATFAYLSGMVLPARIAFGQNSRDTLAKSRPVEPFG